MDGHESKETPQNDTTIQIHNNEPIEKLKLYMAGWKHGAVGQERKHHTGPYDEGYKTGVKMRIEEQRKMVEGYGVNIHDLVDRVLR